MTFDRQTLKPTYNMVIGEAGESCAFYIVDRLGMPKDMLNIAVKAEELYPEDYDMSIVFDSVENRKKHHDMERKYITETINYSENE